MGSPYRGIYYAELHHVLRTSKSKTALKWRQDLVEGCVVRCGYSIYPLRQRSASTSSQHNRDGHDWCNVEIISPVADHRLSMSRRIRQPEKHEASPLIRDSKNAAREHEHAHSPSTFTVCALAPEPAASIL